MRTTPVILDEMKTPPVVVQVELPAGWVRVWSGIVLPGDYHINLVTLASGQVAWVRMTAAKILANAMHEKPIYETSCWFACIIRERSEDRDYGYPCPKCGIRALDPPEDWFESVCLCEIVSQMNEEDQH